ncbi:Aste57867_9517 [Aphanomyces stellatus]|uniref:Aste57867_9517 protein n=1 Tax=Aphanomyces stellatus TaxID=120398 RepID=A0A485KNK2_9STRA|nr:hypothetical protein As57867_009480 [Aphanomyces stellatus]VFT86396.1 Aste57867_9517 [Aphanomyces stellatus]
MAGPTDRPVHHRKATGRPSIKKKARKKPSFKINTFSIAKKLCVINTARDHSIAYASQCFFPGLTGTQQKTAWKRIYRWEQQRQIIQQAASEPSLRQKKSLRPFGTSATLPMEAEEGIVNWVNDLRVDGIPVSHQLLQSRALEVARDLGFSTSEFKGSPSWRKAFMSRWRLSMRARSRSGQLSLEHGEATLAAFSERIRGIVRTHDIDCVYNADQTGINYEYVPKKTIDATGAKTVWIKGSGHEKDRITAMLMADSNGVKYPLFLVMKTAESKIAKVVKENLSTRNGFGRYVWDDIEELHERHPSRLYGNPTAWWNGHISLQFLTYHFGHRRGTAGKPVLLLWDDFSAHFTEEVVALANDLNVLLEKIPPTFTWICQPADVAWMKPFKCTLRRRWVEYLRMAVENHKEGAFQLTPPDRFDLVEWVNTAWDDLPRATIVSGFRKCGLIELAPSADVDSMVEDLAIDAAHVLESLLQCDATGFEELASDLDDVESGDAESSDEA